MNPIRFVLRALRHVRLALLFRRLRRTALKSPARSYSLPVCPGSPWRSMDRLARRMRYRPSTLAERQEFRVAQTCNVPPGRVR